MLRFSRKLQMIIPVFVSFLLVVSAIAMPPSPELIQKWKSEGVYEAKMKSRQDVKIKYNIDQPDETLTFPTLEEMRPQNRLQKSAAAATIDTVNVIVILVEFPDYQHSSTSYTPAGGPLGNISTTPVMFDSLLFSRRGIDVVSNPTGSMTEFYLENSYGRYFVQGDVTNWLMMPQSYSWYVGGDNGMSMGSVLATHAVLAADSSVDFSKYTINNVVPGVIIIHAGPGAESNAYGIWSHKSALGSVGTPDDVILLNYTLNPEEFSGNISSMGVFSHEWGHIMGLPDLYDTGTSPGQGLGNWSMMAGGSWNNGGRTPAHFDAYSKAVLRLPFSLDRFLVPVLVDSFILNAPLPQVESEPVSYVIRGDAGSFQYFMVENRQRVGFDQYLPGHGLCIYHIDFTIPRQTTPYRYRVALEQADGNYDLERGSDQGDPSDTWPGISNKREFHDFSSPAARTNTGDPAIEGNKTQVGIWSISDSDSSMTADLEAQYTRPWLKLTGDSITITEIGNGDGEYNQGESIEVGLEIQNLMGQSFNPTVTISASVPGLQFVNNDIWMGLALNPINTNVLPEPFIVNIPADFPSSIVTFTLTITSAREIRPPVTTYFISEFQFDLTIGKPQILIVDDDAGFTFERFLLESFDRLRVPVDHHDVFADGSPTISDLAQYQSVIWHSSHDRTANDNRHHLDSNDISVLKQYLDNGGNLMYIGNVASVDSLDRIDSSFMAQYFHSVYKGVDQTATYYQGLSHNAIGEGLFFRMTTGGVLWTRKAALISPVNGGDSCFMGTNFNQTASYYSTGVSYSGSYKTIFLSFPADFINEADPVNYTTKDSLLQRVMDFFNDKIVTAIDDDISNSDILPNKFRLEQNYPNPFNPTTTISYTVSAGKAEKVELLIYNMLGRRVKTLVNEEQSPGRYQVSWDGKTDYGNQAATGIYLYRLKRGEESLSKKMILMK